MRRLTRNENQGMIAGVAAGLADYFEIDPVIARLAFVLGAFANGIGVLAYVLCWIIVPVQTTSFASREAESAGGTGEAHVGGEPADRPAATATSLARESEPGRGRLFVGVGLIAIGAFLLIDRFSWFILPHWATLRNLWPLLLVAGGLALLLDALRGKDA